MSAAAHSPSYTPPEAAVQQAHVSRGMDAYQALCAEAERDYEGFWARLAREQLLWQKPFTQVARRDRTRRSTSGSKTARSTRRTTASTATWRTASATRPRSSSRPTTATVTRVTYKELHRARLPVRQRAEGARHQEGRPRRHLHADVGRRRRRDAGLRAHRRDALGGVRRLLGAEPAASASSTPARSPVITADEQMRGGKPLPLKAIVDEALALGGCDAVKQRHRLPAHRRRRSHGTPGATSGCTTLVDEPARHLRAGMGRAPSIRCSSSTRRARPASRRACSTRPAATCCRRSLTMKWTFDLKPDDVFWCTADIGWVTGHTYIAYGPLAVGAHRDRVRRRADLPGRRPLLEDDPGAQGHRSSTPRRPRSAR